MIEVLLNLVQWNSFLPQMRRVCEWSAAMFFAISLGNDSDMIILDAVSILGLLLGVLGSLYLSYDLLGRAGGPLRWLIRLMTPIFVCGVCLGVLGAVLYYSNFDWGPQIALGAALWIPIGTLIGFFNGCFINVSPSGNPRSWFSLRDACLAAVVAFGVGAIEGLMLGLPSELVYIEGLALGLIGGVAGDCGGISIAFELRTIQRYRGSRYGGSIRVS